MLGGVMAIKVKRETLEKLGAKIHEMPTNSFKVTAYTSEPPKPDNDGMKEIVAAVVEATKEQGAAMIGAANEQRKAIVEAINEQRFAILRGRVSENEQIVAALSSLKRPEGWNGNWNVHITKRDALGRISEVQFSPAKP